jgi:hypothetical protein
MQPVKLPPNQLRRFYRGGPAITRFRGLDGGGDCAPEEWIGSVISIFGSDDVGVSRLPRGAVLPLARGDILLVPFAAGDCRVGGRLEAIRCLPPAP